MHQPIKICYLVNALHVGGAERVIAKTVARLDENRYQALVCCLWMGGAIADELERAGVQVVNLDAKNKLDFGILFRLYRLLKEHKPDILHSFLFHANIVGRLVGRLAGVPIIISSERIIEIERKPRLLLNRWTAPLADRVVAVSDAVRAFVINEIGIGPEKVVTIYNGVDLQRYAPNRVLMVRQAHHDALPKGRDRRAIELRKKELGLDPSHRIVGTIGNLEKRKGYEYLLQAAKALLSQDSRDITFLVIGDGSLKGKLEQLAQDLDIASHIIFAGHREDIPAMLSVMDVFVLASVYEGLPNALLEAMAMEKPVVATQVAGIPDVVVDGETGILVPRRDPHALADGIRALLADKERARVMGERGRERVSRLFTVEAMVARTEELYEELIGAKLGM